MKPLSALFVVVLLSASARAGVLVDGNHSLSPVIDSIDEQHVTYAVTAAEHVDGWLEVTIKSTEGWSFESTYPVVDEDGVKRLRWTYHYADGTAVTRLNDVPDGVIPSIRSMSEAGKDIVRMLSAGLQPGSHNLKPGKVKTNDTWGCDLPEFGDIECTSRGNCCDTHDACYAAMNCSSWSWTGIQGPFCQACNVQVVLCITTGLGSSEQPSVCCAAGICGEEYFPPLVDSGVNKDLTPGMEGSEGGGGTSWGYEIPGVTANTGNGTCTFPDGTVVQCG